MKHYFLKWINLCLTGVLAWLGYSCEPHFACDYGVPLNEVLVNGKVCDEEGNPIEGIGLKIIGANIESEAEYDSWLLKFSEPDGSFQVKSSFVKGTDDYTAQLVALDVDSADNGEFLPDTTELKDLQNLDFRDVDAWVSHAEVNDVKVVMKKVTENNQE
ncbi:MAG: radical SAM-associated putative lipoprotein [Paludibacteraceae bacterium]|nr:radical SAM-associated putative lipoprotein [Paludibacteraceae bacterium]